MATLRTLFQFNLVAGLAVLLVACGDGASTVSNPNLGDTAGGYQGPPARTADIRSFQINFWQFLQEDNRCGQCHGVDQVPTFVDKTDVNQAYSVAIRYVSLIDPSSSQIVSKAATGHHCWLGGGAGQACADNIEQMIINWASDSNVTSGRQIQLTAPTITPPGDAKSFPATAFDPPTSASNPNGFNFAITVHPILVAICQGCHTETATPLPIAPFFANDDPNSSYEAAKPKMDIDTPAISRFVVRLRQEAHNCWTDCASDAQTMEDAIADYAGAIQATQISNDLETSSALTLADGIIASGGNRHEANLIALWEFRSGGGNQAFDTSGIDPTITLNLNGSYQWLGGYGLDLSNGYGFANNFDSIKLKDFIETTGEYSIEAWVIPANVTQQNANIVAYSGGSTRNFGLDQEMYDYRYYNRIDPGAPLSALQANGEPFLTTGDSMEEIAQSSLQHVVANYDPINGRTVYVNGQLVNAADPVTGPTTIGNVVWDQNFGFTIGADIGGLNDWDGQLRLVAIHNRALTPAQIVQNFDVGVGQKFYLLFWVGEHLNPAEDPNDPQSFIVMEVSQFDSYGYLFSTPTFVNLDSNWTPPGGGIPVKGIRIGINGKEAVAGQAFANIDTTINTNDYDPATGQQLSSIGTIIGLEKSAAADEFFLTFELIGGSINPYSEAAPTPPATPTDPATPVVSDIGMRTFEEIAATISAMTGIATNDDTTFPNTGSVSVETTYDGYLQQLPAVESIDAFLPSHQMAVAQLALASCNTLVESNPGFFSGLVMNQDSRTAFGEPPTAPYYSPTELNMGTALTPQQIANRNAVIDPLLAAAMNVISDLSPGNLTTQPNAAEVNLTTQPNAAEVRAMFGAETKQDLGVVVGIADEYDSLISQMLGCRLRPLPAPQTCAAAPNDSDRTKQIVKAVCAAAVGSAAMLVQ